MFSTFTTLFVVCYLPIISTIPITIYNNAQFNPIYTQSMVANLSSIELQNACICQCLMNSMCITATYNGYKQYCLLYFAQLEEGQLQLMTIDTNSSVISFKNKTLPGSTGSAIVTTGETSTQVPTQITSPAVTTVIATVSSSIMRTMTTTGTSIAMTTTAVATCTTLVTFDDIASPYSIPGIIPNGYQNLNWDNMEYINASTMAYNSGYRVAVTSSPFVAHNPTGNDVTITTANGTRFSFDSLRLTSAWRDSLSVTMKTIRGGMSTSTGVYAIKTTLRTTVYCNFCTDIDTMTLHAQDGTPNANYAQNGTQFIIDDLCISFGH